MTKENLQDNILNQLRKNKQPCTIHLTNGYLLKDILIRAFDSFVIVIIHEGKQMMFYKHGISSITMPQAINVDPKEQ